MSTPIEALVKLGPATKEVRVALEAMNLKNSRFIDLQEELLGLAKPESTVSLDLYERLHHAAIDLATAHDAQAAHFEQYASKLRDFAAEVQP